MHQNPSCHECLDKNISHPPSQVWLDKIWDFLSKMQHPETGYNLGLVTSVYSYLVGIKSVQIRKDVRKAQCWHWDQTKVSIPYSEHRHCQAKRLTTNFQLEASSPGPKA